MLFGLLKKIEKGIFFNECIIEGGEGSSYGYDGGWVPECDGKKSENGFVKSKISCDFCSANWVKHELKDAEDACREDCRTSNYHCVPADLAELWGGYKTTFTVVKMQDKIVDTIEELQRKKC